MRRYLFLLLLFSTWIKAAAQESFIAHDLNISFESRTKVKEFSAHSSSGSSLINIARDEISFSVPVNSFVFYSLLMQEHFNRDYMESHRLPRATFRGHFTQAIHLGKKGKQPVRVEGNLTIHGKKVWREIDGFLTVKDGTILLESDFPVLLADHQISIPAALKKQIAPTVRIQVRGEYAPSNKNKLKIL